MREDAKRRKPTDPLESSFEIRRRLTGSYGLIPEDAALLEPEEPTRPGRRRPSAATVVIWVIAAVFGLLAVWQAVRGAYVLAVVLVAVAALALFFHRHRRGGAR